jgi:hypothetical protein
MAPKDGDEANTSFHQARLPMADAGPGFTRDGESDGDRLSEAPRRVPRDETEILQEPLSSRSRITGGTYWRRRDKQQGSE